MRSPRAVVAALLLCSVVGCSDLTDPGTVVLHDPGYVAVSLAGLEAPDAALQLFLRGAGIDSLRAGELRMFTAPLGSDGVRVILVGEIGPGELLRFWTSDRTPAAKLVARVEAAAAPVTWEPRSIDSYELRVEPR